MFAPAGRTRRAKQASPDGTRRATTSEDAWEARSDYDKSNFYLRADKKGTQSSPMSIRLAQDMARQVSVFVHSADLPYETTSDFVRDAIMHRMHELLEMTLAGDQPQLRRWLNVQMHASINEMRIAEMKMTSGLIDGMKERAAIATEFRDWAALRELIDEAWDVVDDLRQPYAGQLKKCIYEWGAAIPDTHKHLQPPPRD